jgi:stage V sporulation protein G
MHGEPRTMLGTGQGGLMEVTEVRIFPVQEERLKAYVAITFDNCFVVRDLKVISGNNGLFVAMPSKKRKDGTYRDTAHPLNNETRQLIESKVLEEYNKEIQKSR